MIKLNNKNITYVALADTNNSLKAPKEIWYSDSSNSVKLVYRRKDALIEGEDYEKYHWLKGDGQAKMGCVIECNSAEWKLKGSGAAALDAHRYNEGGKAFQIVSDLQYIGGSGKMGIYDNALTQYFSTTKLPINTIRLVMGTNVGSISINDTDFTNPDYTISRYFELENQLKDKNSANVTYSMSEVKIDDVARFFPCKLLKPIPKWLDANGIRRQVGECGMIDLVSGKFYGNVNSVGTFTVENYYERKEWLCGDGSAYIDVPRSNEVTDVIHFKLDASNSGLGGIRGIFGNLNLGIGGKNTIHFVKYSSNLMACRAFNSGNEVRPVRYNVMDVDILIDSVKVNSDTYELDRDLTALEGYSMPIFSRRRINADLTTNITDEIIKASLAYFKIDDVLNLIPCTLTMDLPASMDANNIARTKGTSGMWDLVSDRFYGNVANSGTFKAVNLAEGVDYEVYEYLNFTYEGNPSVITFMSLPIESDVVSFKRIYNDYANNSIFMTGGDRYSYGLSASTQLIRVWDYDTQEVSYSKPISTETTIRDIESTSTSLIINEVEITKYGFPIDSVVWRCSSSHSCKNSSIYVDGIERYIPVKLLKSIPAKYDANGIARQAGECGMYDTVNDKFYGNVASSGTFSVSDDS